MKYSVILAMALIVVWLVWSGHYDKPFIIFLGALSCVVLYFAASNEGALTGALSFVFLIPPLSNIYNCAPGRPRLGIIIGSRVWMRNRRT